MEVHSQSRIEPTAPYEAPQVPRYQRFIVNLVDKLPEEMVSKFISLHTCVSLSLISFPVGSEGER